MGKDDVQLLVCDYVSSLLQGMSNHDCKQCIGLESYSIHVCIKQLEVSSHFP